jgi:hypothetical protein
MEYLRSSRVETGLGVAMTFDHLEIRGLSRRRFLAGCVAIAGVAAACSRRAKFGSPSIFSRAAGGAPLLVLTDGEAQTLTAFAESVLPTGAAAPSLADTRLIERFDEEFFFVDEAVRADLKLALGALEWLPLLGGYFHRFSHMNLYTRTALVQSMLGSRFETSRAIANSLRFAVHFFYYAHPATWAMSGYDGPFAHLAPQLSEQRMRYLELTKTRA